MSFCLLGRKQPVLTLQQPELLCLLRGDLGDHGDTSRLAGLLAAGWLSLPHVGSRGPGRGRSVSCTDFRRDFAARDTYRRPACIDVAQVVAFGFNYLR